LEGNSNTQSSVFPVICAKHRFQGGGLGAAEEEVDSDAFAVDGTVRGCRGSELLLWTGFMHARSGG